MGIPALLIFQMCCQPFTHLLILFGAVIVTPMAENIHLLYEKPHLLKTVSDTPGELCLEVDARQPGAQVAYQKCSHGKATQMWYTPGRLHGRLRQIILAHSRLCVQVKSSQKVVLGNCDDMNERESWFERKNLAFRYRPTDLYLSGDVSPNSRVGVSRFP